jgi:hypothetical protein
MYTGAHVLDRSPATLAYDDARRVWGAFYEGRPDVDFPTKQVIVTDILIVDHGQHPTQAAFVARTALTSVVEQAYLEDIEVRESIEKFGGLK